MAIRNESPTISTSASNMPGKAVIESLSRMSSSSTQPPNCPNTQPPKLLYHCTFDNAQSIAHPAAGPAGRFLAGSFVPGKNGRALRVGGMVGVLGFSWHCLILTLHLFRSSQVEGRRNRYKTISPFKDVKLLFESSLSFRKESRGCFIDQSGDILARIIGLEDGIAASLKTLFGEG